MRLTQSVVAEACGITQPHLSKILSNKVKLVGRSHRALAAWLVRTSPGGTVAGDTDLEIMVNRLRMAAPNKRIQIMHLLEAVELIVTP
jgi:hypothetical protein